MFPFGSSSQALDYSESHACLELKVPRHLLLRPLCVDADAHLAPTPPKEWRALDSAFASVFVNKTTGGFVCPDMALSGDWKAMQSFLLAWHQNRALKKGERREEKEYPALNVRRSLFLATTIPSAFFLYSLQSMDLETPAEVSSLWQSCVPVESLSIKEFKEVLKAFKLPVRELKPEDFARFEARVSKELDQLVFPVRCGGLVVQLSCVEISRIPRYILMVLYYGVPTIYRP